MLSDIFEWKNTCFPYKDYSTFNLNEMTEFECLSEFRFGKRDILNFDIDLFISDTRGSSLISDPPNELNNLVALYDSELSGIFNRHVPIKKRTVTICPAAP